MIMKYREKAHVRNKSCLLRENFLETLKKLWKVNKRARAKSHIDA
jgi:hypothetical protein